MVRNKASVKDVTVCVVGLGYVGLPLALAFGRSPLKTYGFDINKDRVNQLQKGVDATEELTGEEIKSSSVVFTYHEADVKKANFIIVAVPTPITKTNQPDLRLIEAASRTIGQNLTPGTIVVYESTVYPGVTEDICAPILEKVSGLTVSQDFHIGYSPERINPGDKEHTLEKIVKVVAGQDEITAKKIANVYATVCLAGIHVAPNIKTAEAAKVIENTQRDLNIALVNELSLIFNRLGINTYEVLEAAGTKWNFLKFSPGLVGGHCIGVDPYYLVHKAEELGYHPQVIAAGRRVNDYMPEFVAWETVKCLISVSKIIQNAKVLVMGLTFKENVKDMRNSKIALTIDKLKELGVSVVGYDPHLSADDINHEFHIPSIDQLEGSYDAVIVAKAHKIFSGLESDTLKVAGEKPIIIDINRFYKSLQANPNVIYRSL